MGNAGYYTCTATNRYGTDIQPINVVVTGEYFKIMVYAF